MPPGRHERPPARPAGCARHRSRPPASPSRPLSPAARSCLSSAPHAAASVRRVRCAVRSSSRGAYTAASWAVSGSLRRMCSLGAPPAGCSPAARARRRRDRFEKCYLLPAACAVLLDELTHGCYICGCWRKSGAACCRLSGQTPRTSSGCERGEARGEEDDGRDEEGDGGRGGMPQQNSRSAAACSITTDALPYRFRALPLDAVRLDVPHEHRALDNQGACMATASAPPSADTLVQGAAAPPQRAAHMPVSAAAEELR